MMLGMSKLWSVVFLALNNSVLTSLYVSVYLAEAHHHGLSFSSID